MRSSVEHNPYEPITTDTNDAGGRFDSGSWPVGVSVGGLFGAVAHWFLYANMAGGGRIPDTFWVSNPAPLLATGFVLSLPASLLVLRLRAQGPIRVLFAGHIVAFLAVTLVTVRWPTWLLLWHAAAQSVGVLVVHLGLENPLRERGEDSAT